MEEIWENIKGYEALYAVSNFGRVKTWTKITPRNIKILEGIKSQEIQGIGYRHVHLCKNGKRENFLTHRLVAVHFIPNPENKPEVNHIDSDPSNNHVDNLEWVTASENMKHHYKSGRSNIDRISLISAAMRRRPVTQIALDGTPIKTWPSITDAARSFPKCTTGEICDCLHGHQKTCKGFKWKYA